MPVTWTPPVNSSTARPGSSSPDTTGRPGLLDGFLASTRLDFSPFCNPPHYGSCRDGVVQGLQPRGRGRFRPLLPPEFAVRPTANARHVAPPTAASSTAPAAG